MDDAGADFSFGEKAACSRPWAEALASRQPIEKEQHWRAPRDTERDMRRENAETVRQMYEAFNRGDFAAALESLHPDAELHQPSEMPDAESFYGRDEFARGLRLWLSAWEEPRFEPEEVTGTGDDVIMRVLVRGRGKASGIDSAVERFHVWRMRDGRPQRCIVCLTRAETLEAVRLEE
jgi:ketosteroid isomerase-like protein